MKRTFSRRCAGCQRLQAEIASLRATVAELQEKLASAHKNSRASSKPPSSDIVKPPPPPPLDGRSRRSLGGQPGHEAHFRALLPQELVDGGVIEQVPEICPDCGHGLQATTIAWPPVQQCDIETVALRVVEHRSVAGLCPVCNHLHYGVLPSGIVRGGLVGPRLTALIAYLKGVCHASYTTVRKFLRDVVERRLGLRRHCNSGLRRPDKSRPQDVVGPGAPGACWFLGSSQRPRRAFRWSGTSRRAG